MLKLLKLLMRLRKAASLALAVLDYYRAHWTELKGLRTEVWEVLPTELAAKLTNQYEQSGTKRLLQELFD